MDRTPNVLQDFLDPPCRPDTMAFHSVRTGVLAAVRETAPMFRGRVVDVACGQMPYRGLISSGGEVTEYIGVDLCPVGDSVYRPHVAWNGMDLPFGANTFDCALMTEFLEHHSVPGDVLREVHRVLRAGGFIFATVPFIWNLHELPHDEYRYTPFSLERHFRDAGFHDIRVKALGGWNRALAQMLGLWIQFSGVSGVQRALLKRLVFLIYRWLLRTDKVPVTFDGHENSMFSGLSVTAFK